MNKRKWDHAAYLADLPNMPTEELCRRLRGDYGHAQYKNSPLQHEAARRIEALERDDN